jgi:hypothetical protein
MSRTLPIDYPKAPKFYFLFLKKSGTPTLGVPLFFKNKNNVTG